MRIIILILLISSSVFLNAQTYNMSNTTINTCGGTFYDSGGSTGTYSASQNLTMTFCSNQPGSQISFNFTAFDLEDYFDYIQIYDGVGTGGTQLVVDGTNTMLQGQTIESQGSGCLTFVFTSDGSVEHAGWAASISCTLPCQDFTSDIVTANPTYYNGDTIRVCQNTPVTFTAASNYANNNVNYTQSDATSTFYWDFGDGTTQSGVGLTTVSHSFPEGGFYVFLDVVDQYNCNNTNLVFNTVMVSTTPIFTGTSITDTICPGQTINFTGVANTNTWSQPLPAINGGAVFLPDGSGNSYETQLTYNIFAPGATLTNINDLQSVCINMEHSYAGDLDINIICPNGSTTHLVTFAGTNNLGWDHVGEPVDPGSVPGVGYDYCWTTTPAGQTWSDAADGSNTYNYTDVTGQTYSNMSYIPAGNYDPMGNDWNNLLGCPLNGDWTIQVTDNLGSDDGYIFSWTINWDPSLTTSLWVFGNTYNQAQYTWSGQNINSQTNGVGTAIPSTIGGTEYYTFTATDDFGCSYDTILPIYIHPSNHPGCCVTPIPNAGTNDSICGLTIQLNAIYGIPTNNGLWSYTGTGTITFSDATSNTSTATADTYGEYILTWTELDPAGCQASDMVTINFNPNPNINISSTSTLCFGSSDGSLTVNHNSTLDAPYTYSWNNGINTISNNNISANLYTVTVTNTHGCTTSLSETILEPTLLISNTTTTDVLCFGGNNGSANVVAQNGTPTYTYLWSDATSQTTSTANNLIAGIYTVTVTDNNNCTTTNTVNILEPQNPLTSVISGTNTSCFGSNDGTATITASGGTTPYTYNWSNGNTTSNNTNLLANTYNITITDANNCTSTNSITISQPTLITSSYTSTSLGCAGANNGNISLNVLGGTPNYSFLWNTGATTQNLLNIGGNIYSVTITDANNCSITHNNIVITEPSPVITSVTSPMSICLTNSTDLYCSTMGGTPPYNYVWNTGETNYSITVAPTDTTNYYVYAIDANGCIGNNAETTVNVRPPITATAIGDKLKICPGDPLNITIKATGGNGNYIYTLENGQNVTDYFTVYPSETESIKITVTDNCNSPLDIAIVEVTVLNAPPLSFSADITQGCQPLVVNFVEHSDDENQTFLWTFGDGNSSNNLSSNNTTHVYENSGNFTVGLEVTSVDGCKSYQEIVNLINVYKLPKAKFITEPSNASVLKPEIKFINISENTEVSYWDFGDENTFIGKETFHTYPPFSNNYVVSLIAESDKGCRDTTYSTVYIYDIATLYAPTAFTPDGDGINDTWRLIGSSIDLDNVKLLIYNRWGEIIFETDNFYSEWDGTVKNNKTATNGIYTWLITYKDIYGIEFQQSGTVTLIK